MTTVTSLTAGSALQGTELLYAAQSSADRKITAAQIKDFSATTTISVKQYGATGDGSTDDTAAIQAAIDYALNNNLSHVFIPEGDYVVSNTIHLGYGWGGSSGRYSNVTLEGASGFSPGAFGSVARTRLKATFKDRPILNMQGQQNAGVRGLYFAGPTGLASNYFGWDVLTRAASASYVPSGATDNQRAPFCGVCIDGYYGTAPATPYPTPTYPSWITSVGATSPYGRNQSSHVFVEDCYFENTLIGVMVQPNADGNGDFIRLRENIYSGLKAGVAIGNTQARVTDYTNSMFSGCYTCIDGIGYGGGSGNISGVMENMHADYCYQIFRCNGGWQKGIVISNFYSEVMVRIGDVIGSTTPIVFTSSNFSCSNGDTTTRLMLPVFDGCANAAQQTIKFVGCKFADLYGAAHFNAIATFDNCQFTVNYGAGGVESTAQQKMNYTLLDQFDQTPARSRFLECNTNGTFYSSYDNTTGGSWHSVGFSANSELPYMVAGHHRGNMNLTSVTWTGRTFTATPQQNYCKAGDVFHTSAGWCVLTAASSSAVTATLITHYKLASSAYSMMTSDGYGTWTARADAYMNSNFATLAAAQYFPISTFDYTAQGDNRFWKTVSGSTTLTYVDGAGSAQTIPTGITTSSKVLWTDSGNTISAGLPFGSTVAVSAVGSTTLTMASNAIVSGYWLAAPGIAKVA